MPFTDYSALAANLPPAESAHTLFFIKNGADCKSSAYCCYRYQAYAAQQLNKFEKNNN